VIGPELGDSDCSFTVLSRGFTKVGYWSVQCSMPVADYSLGSCGVCSALL